ncbi:LysR substrate-binding domain-containing protein [Pseudoxanthomonas putridarboris]|uniref:LysR substrate-binding domain-containing protein n=1 Tax=Pseudoxanthomonas putridarboris TaxID=752605 RepID=A0ABU9IZS1_9GAMM
MRSLDPALAEVASGLAALADWRGTPSGAVRLTTLHYGARTVLASRLPAFLLKHPDVSVEVIADDRPVDIVAEGFDAGIRLGEAIDSDMVAVRLEPDVRAVIVGTPDYFDRHGKPGTPRDLEAHLCINYRLVGGGGLRPWTFLRNGREITVRAKGQLIVNDGLLAAAAVRAGAGLGGLMEHEVAEEVAQGRLVKVLDDWCPSFPGCHLYYPNRQITPALKALIETLRWKPE